MRHENTLTGLCVACAVCRHDFSEILAHGRGDDHFSEAPLPTAWIEGRRHRLLPCVGIEEMICSQCNKRVAGIYLPMD
ncbi:MAG: hypothetical protein L7F78_13125 [Syntrophales bacterium LBB04]|nr:hypothetical protein [Syntrophales bacterium LBB04]